MITVRVVVLLLLFLRLGYARLPNENRIEQNETPEA